MAITTDRDKDTAVGWTDQNTQHIPCSTVQAFLRGETIEGPDGTDYRYDKKRGVTVAVVGLSLHEAEPHAPPTCT